MPNVELLCCMRRSPQQLRYSFPPCPWFLIIALAHQETYMLHLRTAAREADEYLEMQSQDSWSKAKRQREFHSRFFHPLILQSQILLHQLKKQHLQSIGNGQKGKFWCTDSGQRTVHRKSQVDKEKDGMRCFQFRWKEKGKSNLKLGYSSPVVIC